MPHKLIAIEFHNLGLNPIPVGKVEKVPLIKNFTKNRVGLKDIENYTWEGIAVSCGVFSQGLECLDFDLKNATDPQFIMDEFERMVDPMLLQKLYCERTPSGGYHYFYKCEDVAPSTKLAVNEDDEIVIETRGEGSIAKTFPSDNYTPITNSYATTPIISKGERLELIVACKLLSKNVLKRAKKELNSDYKPKFSKYNTDPDVGLSLLKDAGWTVFKDERDRVLLTKPNSEGKVSGIFNLGGGCCFLWVYSTSTNFEAEKPYKNSDILAELHFDGRYNVAYAKLFDQGYGNIEDEEKAEEMSMDNLSFLATRKEEEQYLNQSIKDEIPLGLTTGWSELDKYFRFKRNSLVIGLGFEGVGKSVAMLNLAMSSYKLHGWSWGMVVPENKTAMTRRRLIEIITGKPISFYKHSPQILDKYKDIVYDNFHIVSNKKYLSIVEALEMGKRLYEDKKIDVLLIDPYNFFRVDDANTYTWDNKILSLLRVFVEKYCSVYVMLHPRSDAGRSLKDKDGYLTPPNQYQVTGGNNFVNRCDDFFCIHRVRNHHDPTEKKTTHFISYKTKEIETGGAVHVLGQSTELRYDTIKGFTGFFDCKGGNPFTEKSEGEQIF